MKAIRQRSLGGPEALESVTVPRPQPAPTEVLVRVRAAGVNPVDWKTRAAGGPLGEPPFTVGWDVAGVIEELGFGVTRFAVGDRGSLTAWQLLVDTAGVQTGDRVLIHAAAGGTGSLAVQIAKRAART